MNTYKQYTKRLLDLGVSGAAIIVFSPLLLGLTISGTIAMKGNPFFVYPRAGKNEKVFNLIKFRSMANIKDSNGEFISDEKRINRYGKILRSTSLDELPELINILKGDMSLVGPRPLSFKYLDYYTEEEKHRHDVRPGLTGLAQVNGRNAISWEERFAYDIQYVNNVSFATDLKIVLKTITKVLKRENIGEGSLSVESLHIIRAHDESSKGDESK